MEAALVFASAISFLIFLIIPDKFRKYPAIAGWVFIVASVVADIPYYINSENNFLYPVIGILGIPFVIITAGELLKDNKYVLYLSKGDAISFLFYVSYWLKKDIHHFLHFLVTSQCVVILNAIGFDITQLAWNLVSHDGFRVEIILACTGLQAIAIMLGLAFCVPSTFNEKILSFLVVAPVIYILNLFRNVFVIMAYTGQWLQVLPEIASNGEYGYESFFWAHNVIAELGALVFLIVLALLLFRINRNLGVFSEEIVNLYYGKIKDFTGGFGRGK